MHDDEDRAAILRRREILIALALSGLTGATGCDEPAPGGLLEAPQVEEATGIEGEGTSPAAAEASPEGAVAAVPEPTPEGAATPVPEPYEPDPEEVRHAEDQKRRWRTRPMTCLSVRTPRPHACLGALPYRRDVE